MSDLNIALAHAANLLLSDLFVNWKELYVVPQFSEFQLPFVWLITNTTWKYSIGRLLTTITCKYQSVDV